MTMPDERTPVTEQGHLSVSRYVTPDAEQRAGRKKVVVRLAGTDTIRPMVQCVAPKGGDTNLHAHPHTDGFWFVLTGRSRWYGADDQLLAELGPMESIMVPKGTKYWFEASSEEPLEILHIAVTTPGIDPRLDRVDVRPAADDSERPSIGVDAEQRHF
jgi:mannose-6-phosphate isomerase-like protein (cupin superfamily)